MNVRKPHFLMFCDSTATQHIAAAPAEAVRCKWRCVIDDLEQPNRTELTDCESTASPERGPLMAVVRGLEALDQPSQVTLVTPSAYVNKGLRYGLKQWRENNYHWEHFGSERPIRNADLWQRIDAALQFHRVDCRLIETAAVTEPEFASQEFNENTHPVIGQESLPPIVDGLLTSVSRLLTAALGRLRLNIALKAITNGLRLVLELPERCVFAFEATLDAILQPLRDGWLHTSRSNR